MVTVTLKNEIDNRARLLEALSIASSTATELECYPYADLLIDAMYALNFGKAMTEDQFEAFRKVARKLQQQVQGYRPDQNEDLIIYIEAMVLKFEPENWPNHWK